MLNNGGEDWYTILYMNKPVGKILVESNFVPKDSLPYKDLLIEF